MLKLSEKLTKLACVFTLKLGRKSSVIRVCVCVRVLNYESEPGLLEFNYEIFLEGHKKFYFSSLLTQVIKKLLFIMQCIHKIMSFFSPEVEGQPHT